MRSLFIAGFLASILSVPAMAAQYDAQISFTAPTTRVGGAPLSASDIAGYKLFHGCDTASPQQQGSQVSGPSPINAPAFFPADGTYKVCMKTVDTGGRESAFSNTFTLTVASVGNPGSPNLTGVTLSCPGGTAPRVVAQTATELTLECTAP